MTPPILWLPRGLWLPRRAGLALALLLLLLAVPAAITLLLSLQRDGNADPFAGPFNPAAWLGFLRDSDLVPVLLRNLAAAALLGLVASALALAPAYVAALTEISRAHPLGRLVLFLALLVLLADQVVTVIGWSEIGRLVLRLLAGNAIPPTTMPEPPFAADLPALEIPGWHFADWNRTTLLVWLAELHRALALALLCQWAAMRRVIALPRMAGLIETALECGASHVHILRRLVLPQAAPDLRLGFLLASLSALGAFMAPALLGSGRDMSLGQRLQKALEIDSNWPLGAFIALLMLVVTLLGIWAFGRPWRRDGNQPVSDIPPAPLDRPALPGETNARAIAATLTLRQPVLWLSVPPLILLAAPLLWMAVLSLRYAVSIAQTAGLPLFLRALMIDPHLLPAIGFSLLASLGTAAIACVAGSGLACLWRVWLQARPARYRLVLLTALPFILPSIAFSTMHLAAHLFLTTWLPIRLGLLAVMLAEILRVLPLAAAIFALAWHRVPGDLAVTVAELGLDPRPAWRQVVAPLLRPAGSAAFAACFLLSLGDFQLGNALSGETPLLSPSLLSGIATQRSPLYMALVAPILALTAALCWSILTRLDGRPKQPRSRLVTALPGPLAMPAAHPGE
ncbi:MAG: ABC transporter permease subunit [Dongiaceae bacterium]